MPLPPPPATAFIIMAAPSPKVSKKAIASSNVVVSKVPSIVGTPQLSANRRASILFPNKSNISGRGPINNRPSSTQLWAKASLSLKNP